MPDYYKAYHEKTFSIDPSSFLAPLAQRLRPGASVLDVGCGSGRDLAELYDVETKYLKRTVRRNIKRFPKDFMFELGKKEFENLRSHFGTSSWGGARYTPMAFTEQGVAMLASVLNSDRSIEVNIAIMRTFVKLKETLSNHKDLAQKLLELEQKLEGHYEQIQAIFEAIRQLMAPDESLAKKIGFIAREKQKTYGH